MVAQAAATQLPADNLAAQAQPVEEEAPQTAAEAMAARVPFSITMDEEEAWRLAEYRRRQKSKKTNRRRAEKVLLEWVLVLFISLLIVLVLTQVLFVNSQIPSESMEDTIQPNDRIIGLRPAYLFSDAQQEDIIIFRYPDDESQLYVKRVIGLPGDTVEIFDGQVYINGSFTPLDSSYVKGDLFGNFGPYVVPENCYFVLGDNRAHSWDSRYWTHTYVKEGQIVGKVVLRLYPEWKVFD